MSQPQGDMPALLISTADFNQLIEKLNFLTKKVAYLENKLIPDIELEHHDEFYADLLYKLHKICSSNNVPFSYREYGTHLDLYIDEYLIEMDDNLHQKVENDEMLDYLVNIMNCTVIIREKKIIDLLKNDSFKVNIVAKEPYNTVKIYNNKMFTDYEIYDGHKSIYIVRTCIDLTSKKLYFTCDPLCTYENIESLYKTNGNILIDAESANKIMNEIKEKYLKICNIKNHMIVQILQTKINFKTNKYDSIVAEIGKKTYDIVIDGQHIAIYEKISFLHNKLEKTFTTDEYMDAIDYLRSKLDK